MERKDYQVKFSDVTLGGRKKREQFKEYMDIGNNEVHVCRLLLLTLANAHSFQGPVVSEGSTERSAAPQDHILQLYPQAAFWSSHFQISKKSHGLFRPGSSDGGGGFAFRIKSSTERHVLGELAVVSS